MKITLLVEGIRHAVELTEAGVTIGRGEAATIRVLSNAVSRVHARIWLKEGKPHVEDLKSLNGTTIRGLLVTQPQPLVPGDTILLGEVPVTWEEQRVSGFYNSGISHRPDKPAPESLPGLEERAFDPSGSIIVPHADLEGLMARHRQEKSAQEVEALYQRLATMAARLMRATSQEELMGAVMTLVTSQIKAQRGSIVLVGADGDLEPAYTWEETPGALTQPISRTIARTAMADRVTIITTDARVDPRFAAGESIKIHGISSVICAPLVVEEQALGAIYLESSLNRGGFKREDEALLGAMANFAAMGIQREREARFRQRLERYHSPQVVGQILQAANAADAPLLQAQRCEISVLFADISGFTRMSEHMEPLQLASILNRSFEVLTDQIFARGGTLDKYIGDAIMAFFGAPAADPDHARHAVEAAVAMQQGLHFLNENRPDGYPELRMRIGINSGEAFAGDIGCEKRMDYTVMGSTVNLASRLESGVAKPGMIVVGPRTAELLKEEGLRALPPVTLKGIELDLVPYEVLWEV